MSTVHPIARQSAAHMIVSLLPKRTLPSLRVYERFCEEVLAEAGPAELARITRTIRQHSDLMRGAA